MIFLIQDIKHLLEFWDKTKEDKKYNDNWRILISGNQKQNWPVNKKLVQKQLSVNHQNVIRLLEEDGFDGNPVLEGQWGAVKKYLDITGWPSSYDILRISDFFHISFIQTTLLCLKTSFEKSLIKNPNSPHENTAKMQYAEDYINKAAESLADNIDQLKFKIKTRDFRSLIQLFDLFDEYYKLPFNYEKFRELVLSLFNQKVILMSIFAKDFGDIDDIFNDKFIIKSQNKESAVLFTLKVQWLDTQDDLADRIEDLNHILKQYGINIKDWRTGASDIFNQKILVDLIRNFKKESLEDTLDIQSQIDLIDSIFNQVNSGFYNKELYPITTTFFTQQKPITQLFTISNIEQSNSFYAMESFNIQSLKDFESSRNETFINLSSAQKIKVLEKDIKSMSLLIDSIDSQIEDIRSIYETAIINSDENSTLLFKEQLSQKLKESLDEAINEYTRTNETQINLGNYEMLLRLKELVNK